MRNHEPDESDRCCCVDNFDHVRFSFGYVDNFSFSIVSKVSKMTTTREVYIPILLKPGLITGTPFRDIERGLTDGFSFGESYVACLGRTEDGVVVELKKLFANMWTLKRTPEGEVVVEENDGLSVLWDNNHSRSLSLWDNNHSCKSG